MKKALLGSLLVLAATALPQVASADVYNFDSDTVGNAPAGWSSHGSVTLTVTNDGTSNVMTQSATGGTEYAAVTLSSPVSLADGDSLSLSYDAQITTSPVPGSDRSFRAGLYNSSATSPAGGPFTNATVGYLLRIDEGNDASSHAADIRSSPGALSSSSTNGTTPRSSDDSAWNIQDNLLHTIVLTITRSGDSLTTDLSMSTAGGTPISLSGTDSSSPVLAAIQNSNYTFDEVLIGNTSPLDFNIDNVTITHTTAAVPEPASLGLLGLGALAMLRRRRKA